MILGDLALAPNAASQADECMRWMHELYPICRTIAGPAVRQTFDLLGQWLPLERFEVPTGTPVFDWEVPREWELRDAYVADAAGHRVIDARAHNLHVVNYSVGVDATMTLEELQPHLHSLPERPDWIPYRTSYYKDDWGFCLRHREREALGPGPYRVVIDAEHRPGHLSYAECVVPGSSEGIGIVYTHSCHPSLANDNLTGIAVAAALARALRRERPRLTWRFVFGPGTIGSLTWLAKNEPLLPRVRAGLTLGLLGDRGPLTYKRSRRGDTGTDRVAARVLEHSQALHRVVDFEPYGYDERQFCSPGFDLAVGRLSRAQHGEYPEYHSSADDMALVSSSQLAEAIIVAARLIAALDANGRYLNLNPKGEPRLGKRGLYGDLGGQLPGAAQQALLWVLSYSDAAHDLLAIAERSGLPLEAVAEAAARLERAGLLRACEDRSEGGSS